MVVILVVIVIFFIVVVFSQKRKKTKQEEKPLIILCQNNALTAVVLAEDYKITGADGNVHAVTGLKCIRRTMLFSRKDWRGYKPLQSVLTGTEKDLEALLKGCRVIDTRNLFVPYSSGVWNEEWQRRFFEPVSLEEAWKMIHGRKMP